jgi:hypothetical protein
MQQSVILPNTQLMLQICVPILYWVNLYYTTVFLEHSGFLLYQTNIFVTSCRLIYLKWITLLSDLLTLKLLARSSISIRQQSTMNRNNWPIVCRRRQYWWEVTKDLCRIKYGLCFMLWPSIKWMKMAGLVRLLSKLESTFRNLLVSVCWSSHIMNFFRLFWDNTTRLVHRGNTSLKWIQQESRILEVNGTCDFRMWDFMCFEKDTRFRSNSLLQSFSSLIPVTAYHWDLENLNAVLDVERKRKNLTVFKPRPSSL